MGKSTSPKKPSADAAKKPAARGAKVSAPRSAQELVEAAATGKSKDRVAALSALVGADPVAAEKVVLSWLEPSVLDDERLYSLVNAAAETAGALGTRTCIERIARIAHGGLPIYGAFASKKALATTKSPATAAIIVSTLGDAAIKESVASSVELLELLVKRGQAGNHARVRAIHDAAALLGKSEGPEMQKHWTDALTNVTEKLLALPE